MGRFGRRSIEDSFIQLAGSAAGSGIGGVDALGENTSENYSLVSDITFDFPWLTGQEGTLLSDAWWDSYFESGGLGLDNELFGGENTDVLGAQSAGEGGASLVSGTGTGSTESFAYSPNGQNLNAGIPEWFASGGADQFVSGATGMAPGAALNEISAFEARAVSVASFTFEYAIQAVVESAGDPGAIVKTLGAGSVFGSLEGFLSPYSPFAMTNVGAVTSQGDAAMGSDTARSLFNVDGTGITIGVLSDSYNNLGGAASDIFGGDLPATGVNVLSDLGGGGTDEGRAMLQLIHDVAPGASLAFRTAFNGQADFAQGIIDLANAGADVIVDDVVYLNEPFFQDGIIAQAVNQVVAQGISYFSSAGNSARDSYESSFRPSNWLLGNEILHDFGGGDPLQSITIQPFSLFSISLQWDQPFASTLAPGSPGSASDIDLFILDAFATRVLFQSVDYNIGADPVEVLQLINTGPLPVDVNLAIGHFAGPVAGLMKYVIFGGGTINEYATNSSTTIGHANAAGAEAVGAAFYNWTPAFGTNPAVLESYSSLGGTQILFDTAGNRLATPLDRGSVDIVAPDGTNTTFFGFDSAADPDTFPNFFGTSAAAPHAAAVAALLEQIDGALTPEQIYATLENSALDMDNPYTAGFDTGWDPATGFGLIDAAPALSLAGGVIQGDGNANTLTGTWVGDTINGLGGNDILNGGDGNDTLDGGGGADVMIGGLGDDTYIVDNVGDTVVENAGKGTDGVTTSLSYSLGANLENLTLTGGADLEGTGNALDNIIVGNTGANRLLGNDGIDRMFGGAGADQIFGGEGADLLNGDGDADIIAGEGGNDSLWGGDGNDQMDGGAGSDSLFGGDGDDDLKGGAGIDTLRGGLGDDVFVIDEVGDQALEEAGEGTDTVTSFVDVTLAANVENLNLAGTVVLGVGNELINEINGNAEDNWLDGKAGADIMRGGLGNDTYIFDDAGDVAHEAAGQGTLDTVIQLGAFDYTLSANVERLWLGDTGDFQANGNSLDNEILGNAGNNILNGAGGADTMFGGLGDDLYIVDNLGDVVGEQVGAGTDTVNTLVDYTLTVNVENLNMIGTADVTVVGNALANQMIGNAGANTLTGAGGDDSLWGGAGDDLFVFNNGAGDDTVNDFAAGAGSDDKLDIQAFGFANFAAVQAAATNVGANVLIQLDADDSVTLIGVQSANLHQDDFLF